MVVRGNIEAIMAARGVKAAELARQARLNPTGIYDILSGKSQNPKIDTLQKIASALGVSIAVLFEERSNQDLRDELSRLVALLPPAQQQQILLIARAWAGLNPPI